jgi:hypothetical protein
MENQKQREMAARIKINKHHIIEVAGRQIDERTEEILKKRKKQIKEKVIIRHDILFSSREHLLKWYFKNKLNNNNKFFGNIYVAGKMKKYYENDKNLADTLEKYRMYRVNLWVKRWENWQKTNKKEISIKDYLRKVEIKKLEKDLQKLKEN